MLHVYAIVQSSSALRNVLQQVSTPVTHDAVVGAHPESSFPSPGHSRGSQPALTSKLSLVWRAMRQSETVVYPCHNLFVCASFTCVTLHCNLYWVRGFSLFYSPAEHFITRPITFLHSSYFPPVWSSQDGARLISPPFAHLIYSIPSLEKKIGSLSKSGDYWYMR